MPEPLRFRCPSCSEVVEARLDLLRCASCGGPFDLVPQPLDASAELTGFGVWRYLPWLPVESAVSLGEPMTPLVRLGDGVSLKLEGALPTGSFKDRGMAVLVAWLVAMGATRVIEDSSGNAGAALAAYCARAGIGVDMYVPASAPAAKLGQISAFGARLVAIEGPRAAATAAAEEAAADGAIYASHAWHPLFPAGTQTFAWELWEQGGRTVPDVVVFPVGHGGLLLGAHLGFAALRDAGVVDRVPRLVCAQAEACAPLVAAFAAGADEPAPVEAVASLADGIQIPSPVRGRSILAAVGSTGGTAVAVSEEEIREVYDALAARGTLIERTSAVAVAALAKPGVMSEGDEVVVAATGSGLKTPPV